MKLAVFVDGCFWHGCPQHGTKPKTNAKFWRDKIAGNRARDRRVNYALRKRGWMVIRVWEHELRSRDEAKLIRRLSECLARSAAARMECDSTEMVAPQVRPRSKAKG